MKLSLCQQLLAKPDVLLLDEVTRSRWPAYEKVLHTFSFSSHTRPNFFP